MYAIDEIDLFLSNQIVVFDYYKIAWVIDTYLDHLLQNLISDYDPLNIFNIKNIENIELWLTTNLMKFRLVNKNILITLYVQVGTC